MEKLRVEQVERSEVDRIAEALGGCIELTNGFLEEAFSEDLRKILTPLSCEDRALALSGCIGEGYYFGTILSPLERSIVINTGEIEIQLPPGATPEEYFSEPEEWLCEHGLCYYSPGYGIKLEVNMKRLKNNIKDIRRK